jgi:thioredoxin-dependent peroxiredoxin
MARQLAPGDKAPDFSLSDHTGAVWRLSDALANGPIVLFFYPKDDTPICTAEACTFRDQHQIFAERGARVVGVSSDSVASHKAFAKKHELPYTLLADAGGKVRGQFGVKKTLGLFEGRVTFIIAQDQTIVHAFSSALNAKQHVAEALSALDKVSPR